MARDPFDELRNAAIAAGYSVREAVPEDAEEFTRVHAAVWRATYAGLLPEETLAGLDTPESVEMRRGWIEDAGKDPQLGLLVATDRERRIVGLGAAGPGRDEDPPVRHELRAINVLPEAQGTGVSHLLMDALIGTRAAYLWVLRDNPRAITFYRKYGFQPEGATKDFRGAVEERWVRFG